MRAASPMRFGPWRRALQGSAAAAVLAGPWVEVGGHPVLRVDLSRRTLDAFGAVFSVEELYLLFLLVAASGLGFLLLTVVLGRVWCGWACPQTVLSDLVEALAGRAGGALRPFALHAVSAVVSSLLALTLLGYLLPPREVVSHLAAGALPTPAAVLLAGTGSALYLYLVFVRRRFCRAVCPYGRIQAAVAEPGTLGIGVLAADAPRCVECGACRRACPTGVDVRQGEQIGCIQCARCVDACAGVMARRGGPPVVRYAFGAGTGARQLWSARTALLGVATAAAFATLGAAVAHRAPVAFSVRRTSPGARALPDGGRAVFFTAYASNRGSAVLSLTLGAERGGAVLAVSGPGRTFALAPGERLTEPFAVTLPVGSSGTGDLVLSVVDRAGRRLGEASVVLGPGEGAP